MTTTSSTSVAVPKRSVWRERGFGTLLWTELKLFMRDPGTVFFALAFPTVMYLGVGIAIPGMNDVIDDPGAGIYFGTTPVSLYAPVILAVALGTVSLTTMPAYIATYREHKVLRRLSTTPMRPQAMLAAVVILQLGALLIASIAAVILADVVFGLEWALNWPVVGLAFAVGGLTMFGLGLLIAAVSPKATVASAIGMTVYFPMLFFAGVWSPGPAMNDTIATIGSYTPLGAASQALSDGWFDAGFPTHSMIVMAVYIVVSYPLAVRLFRWS